MVISMENALAELQRRKRDMDAYNEIMSLYNHVDISVSEQFQKRFTYFYKVRRNKEWRKFYYSYFERLKNNKDIRFEQIIRAIYKETGRVEASFSSKMLATIECNMPIIDSIVLQKLDMKISGRTPLEKLEQAIQCHSDLVNWYKCFLNTKEAKEYLLQFDSVFQEYKGFSATKKIDFILWANHREQKLESREIEINGCIEVPSDMTEEEFISRFIAFIESNHWYFGGGIRLLNEEKKRKEK